MSDDRILALEEQLAHQEFAIDELNGVVYEQQKRIEALERQCRLLADQLRKAGGAPGPEERPPHY